MIVVDEPAADQVPAKKNRACVKVYESGRTLCARKRCPGRQSIYKELGYTNTESAIRAFQASQAKTGVFLGK
jgi:hypothetical protein